MDIKKTTTATTICKEDVPCENLAYKCNTKTVPIKNNEIMSTCTGVI